MKEKSSYRVYGRENLCRAEAKRVSIYEYDEEKHMRMEREQSYAEGMKQGREQEQNRLILAMHEKGYKSEQIADLMSIDIKQVKLIVQGKWQREY